MPFLDELEQAERRMLGLHKRWRRRSPRFSGDDPDIQSIIPAVVHERVPRTTTDEVRMAQLGVLIADEKRRCCKGRRLIRFGRKRNGGQRYRCTNCDKTSSELVPRSTGLLWHLTVEKYYLSGQSIRATARNLQLSKHQVHLEFRRLRQALGQAYCGCGKQAGHRGWCSFLYRQSPTRQAIVRRFPQGGG